MFFQYILDPRDMVPHSECLIGSKTLLFSAVQGYAISQMSLMSVGFPFFFVNFFSVTFAVPSCSSTLDSWVR